jgi:hypothetical protein
MNAFDGLLPPRGTPPALPGRGGPAAVVGAAKARRRRRVTKVASAGGAVSLAFAGFAVLRPPPATHGIVAGGGPRHTAPPSAPVEAGVDGPRPVGTPAGGPTATPVPNVPVSPGSTPVGALPRPSGSPSPRATPTPTPAPRRYTEIDRTVVADDPTAECAVRADDQLCFRYTGPHAAALGRPVDVSYDFCARVADTTVTFPGANEASFTLTQGSNTTPAMWHGDEPARPAPHAVVVSRGTCLRFTAHWDGRTDDGSVLPAGTYYVFATMNDVRSDSAYGPGGDSSIELS